MKKGIIIGMIIISAMSMSKTVSHATLNRNGISVTTYEVEDQLFYHGSVNSDTGEAQLESDTEKGKFFNMTKNEALLWAENYNFEHKAEIDKIRYDKEVAIAAEKLVKRK